MAKGGIHGHGQAAAVLAPLTFDVTGTDGNDWLVAQQGQVSASGGAGNDLLYGFRIADGGDGNDTLYFGGYNHPGDPVVSLTGGAGADRFIFDDGKQTQAWDDASQTWSPFPAHINDFQSGLDTIWLAGGSNPVVVNNGDGTWSATADGTAGTFYLTGAGDVPNAADFIFAPYDGMGGFW